MVGGENRHNDARSAIVEKNEILIHHACNQAGQSELPKALRDHRSSPQGNQSKSLFPQNQLLVQGLRVRRTVSDLARQLMVPPNKTRKQINLLPCLSKFTD
jgi:hypothetical protein